MPGVCRAVATAGAEQAEPVVESFEEFVDGQDAQSSCGDLQGEGQAVQSPAHTGDGIPVGLGDAETGGGGLGPVGEEGHGRGGVGILFQGARPGQQGPFVRQGGKSQWSHRQHTLGTDVEGLSAGGEDAQLRYERE